MCLKAGLAKRVAQIGQSVRKSLCDDGLGNVCPFKDQCGSMRLEEELRDVRGGLIVGTHAHLTLPLEYLRAGKIDLVIIDEGFTATLDRSSKVPVDRFRMLRLPNAKHRTYEPRKGESPDDAAARHRKDTIEFEQVHRKAVNALDRAEKEGRQVRLSDFRAEHLSPGDCRFAAGVEYTHLGKPVIHPGMSEELQTAALERAVQKEAFALARFWTLVGHELGTSRQGELMSVAVVNGAVDEAGNLANLVVMDFTADARFQSVPVLMLDANANVSAVERFFPGLEVVEIAAEWSEAVTVRQVTDRTGGKTRLSDPSNVDRLHLLMRHVADRDMERVDALFEKHWRDDDCPDFRPLIVTHMAVEEAWREKGRAFQGEGPKDFDAPFQAAHFGAIRGKDGWKHVTSAVVAGRQEPTLDALERIARALHYRSETEIVAVQADEKGERRLPRRDVLVKAKDGSCATVSVSHHPDPRVDALLRQIREGEVAQSIARPRPVWRDRSNPLEILVLTNVPLDVQPDTLTTWAEVIPDRWREMELAGFVPDLACDVAAAYPALFASSAAVRQAASRRTRKCDEADSDFYRSCHTFTGSVRVEWRMEGNRRGRQGSMLLLHDDTPETVAQRLREKLPAAYGVVILGALPDALEAPVAALDAAVELDAYLDEIEEAGEVIWWRIPPETRRPPLSQYGTRPVQDAARRHDPGGGVVSLA
ncbi:hypothetical protein [Aureimonas psammosilenae]|uniref:hypothetical protein n=1 Tax=Aureimonas psammosilenae TaxID=2495496 RepID=UPI0012605C2F|nr:hypothetical protein [Aureimonas psammosilenae]